MNIAHHIPLLLPAAYLFGGLLGPLLGFIRKELAYLLSLAMSALVLALSIRGLFLTMEVGRTTYRLGGWKPPMGIEFVLDPLSAFFSVLVSGVGLVILFYSRKSVLRELGEDKYSPFYSLAMLLLAGLIGMVITGDMFNLYVFLEITAVSSYALVCMGDKKAPLGAFRYLTLGTAAAAFYLIGLALIYIEIGSLNMADITAIMHESPTTPPILVGIILVILGVGLKTAVFPMHAWLADAYTYASSAATALIAPIGTKVSAYILIRFMFFVIGADLISDQTPVATLVGYLGLIGMIWGSLMAICQKELKRMLAYSSVAQIGYIALGIGLASPFGFIGAVLHALNHAFMKGCLFCVSGNLRYRLGHSTIPRFQDTIRLKMPWTAAAFTVAAISMVGLPPMAGFFSKWYLVLGSIEQSNWIFVAALILSSLLNTVYFFRILEKVYMKPIDESVVQEEGPIEYNEAPGSMLFPTLFLAGGIIVLGVFNAYIVTTFIMPMIPHL